MAPADTSGSGVGPGPPADVGSAPGPSSSTVPDTTDLPASRPAQDQPQLASRTHVVKAGESLWSIAQGELGQRATPASVARLVNQLWELNLERIGTGDPNLIMVGTQLRLPS